jgi:hypothetical protein
VANRDPHQALKSEVVGQARTTGIEVVLARLQWSKSEIGYSLHFHPSQCTMGGMQFTDLLAMLGFTRSGCPFTSGTQCYWRWVGEGFDASGFATAFLAAYKRLQAAEGAFEQCGYVLVGSKN